MALKLETPYDHDDCTETDVFEADTEIGTPLTIMMAAELMDLRKQFDQDRKRIAELRESRNFKPY